MHKGFKMWLETYLLFNTGGNWKQKSGLPLRGNFKLINQARESNGQEMVATELVLHFGPATRSSDDPRKMTAVWSQRLFAISAYLIAERMQTSSPVFYFYSVFLFLFCVIF